MSLPELKHNSPFNLTDGLNDLAEEIPSIKTKMIIDMVNGIEVVEEQIRYKSSRNKGQKIFDSIIGDSTKREELIQNNTIGAVKNLSNLTKYMIEEMIIDKEHLCLLTYRLQDTRNKVAQITNGLKQEIKGFRADIEMLDHNLKALNYEYSNLKNRVNRLELKDKTMMEIDLIFEKWNAGVFDSASLLSQLVFVLENIVNSSFGLYCTLYDSQSKEFKQLVFYRLINGLKDRFPAYFDKPVRFPEYIENANSDQEKYIVILSYILHTRQKSDLPITATFHRFFNGSNNTDIGNWFNQNKHEDANFMLKADRLTEKMLNEFMNPLSQINNIDWGGIKR